MFLHNAVLSSHLRTKIGVPLSETGVADRKESVQYQDCGPRPCKEPWLACVDNKHCAPQVTFSHNIMQFAVVTI